jgi:hypothetical protein
MHVNPCGHLTLAVIVNGFARVEPLYALVDVTRVDWHVAYLEILRIRDEIY